MQSEKGCPVCGNGATVQASTAVASMSENPQPAVKADGSPAPIQRVAQLSGTASEAPGNAQGSEQNRYDRNKNKIKIFAMYFVRIARPRKTPAV